MSYWDFHAVSMVNIPSIKSGDYIQWYDLEGTVLEIVRHENGYVYSLWIHNPNHEWMNNFEWILMADDFLPLPRIRRGNDNED